MADTCETCRFIGSQSTKGRGLFACRRYPPTVHVVVESRVFEKDHYKGIATWKENSTDISMWPMTAQANWCGEHQPRLNGGAAHG